VRDTTGALIVDNGFCQVDDTVLEWSNADMWWGGSWSNPSKTLEGCIDLGVGVHHVDFYGAEFCCDGYQQLQFQA
jgi:hypothetical protein